jgi:hypothetical protein
VLPKLRWAAFPWLLRRAKSQFFTACTEPKPKCVNGKVPGHTICAPQRTISPRMRKTRGSGQDDAAVSAFPIGEVNQIPRDSAWLIPPSEGGEVGLPKPRPGRRAAYGRNRFVRVDDRIPSPRTTNLICQAEVRLLQCDGGFIGNGVINDIGRSPCVRRPRRVVRLRRPSSLVRARFRAHGTPHKTS